MRDAGISRHAAWHQQTPDGTSPWSRKRMTAGEWKVHSIRCAFDAWFREVMKEVHGLDISQPGPPVTKVLDVQL